MSTPEFITIADNTYKTSDLSETAINLANGISTIQAELAHRQAQIAICNTAHASLMQQLLTETSSLTPVTPDAE